MNSLMVMFVYVGMNILLKINLKQIVSCRVKLIMYGLINIIPVIYLGLMLIEEGTTYLIMPMI